MSGAAEAKPGEEQAHAHDEKAPHSHSH
jgi:hypothetical protein